MRGIPDSTEFNKRIPKQTFYENLEVSSSIKKSFVEQIRTIYWRNKISPETMNLEAGGIVDEIQIFEIKLSGRELDESVLSLIDKKIPYHIVFILENEGKYQAWTAYKEATVSGNNAFKVGTYYHTQWIDEDEIPLRVEGLSTDKVYENFVRQIAGDMFGSNVNGESLKDSVDREQEISAIKKEINRLRSKIKKEKQLNVQMELNNRVKELNKKLDEYGL